MNIEEQTNLGDLAPGKQPCVGRLACWEIVLLSNKINLSMSHYIVLKIEEWFT